MTSRRLPDGRRRDELYGVWIPSGTREQAEVFRQRILQRSDLQGLVIKRRRMRD